MKLYIYIFFKSCIQDTLNLSTSADSSTNTKTDRNRQKVMFHISHVMCHVSPVTCCLSLTPIARATHPPPTSSPAMQSRLIRKDPKTRKKYFTQKIIANVKDQKTSKGMPISAIYSQTRSLQSNIQRGFQTWTNIVTYIATYRLNWPRGQFSENIHFNLNKPNSQAAHRPLTDTLDHQLKYIRSVKLP